MPRVRGERGGLELTTAALRAFTCCRERKKSCSSSSEEAEEPSALDDALEDGRLAPTRWSSYLEMLDELQQARARQESDDDPGQPLKS